jgi:hypothetical protein
VEGALPDRFLGKLSLFVLAGQSNMSGRGELPQTQTGHPRVFLFGTDYRWKAALEPVDDPAGQVDDVSKDAVPDAARYGPGLSFGIWVADERPDLAIALVPCAKGDTTIGEWQRNLSDSTLYGSCLKRIRAASVGGVLSGLLFFQGEADAQDPARSSRAVASSDYATRFEAFVHSLRSDLSSPSMPVVFAQIGTQRSPQFFTNWETIREQQRAVSLGCSAMISTDDLPLGDNVHFTTDGYRIIGQRFASAYLELIGGGGCR